MEALITFSFFCVLFVLYIFVVFKENSKNKLISFKRTLPRLKWCNIRLPILDGYLTLIKLRNGGVKLIANEIQKYGSAVLVPLADSEAIFVTDVNIVKKILSSNCPEHLNKPKCYEQILTPAFSDGLMAAEYNVWSVHRKALAPAATYKGFATYVKFMNMEAQDLAVQACNLSDQSNVSQLENQHMKKLIDSCILKTITNILMGTEKKDVSYTSRAEFYSAYRKYKDLGLERFDHPEQFIPIVWKFHPRKRRMDKCLAVMNGFSNMIANSYRQKAANKPNLQNIDKNDETGVKPFQCMVEQLTQAGLSNKEIIDEINILLGAGHDTIIVALDLLIFHLAKNRDCQEKCFAELQTVFKQKQNSLDKFISMDVLSQLKYLERCVLEAMRITPTVPFFLRRIDAPLQISNQKIIEANQVVGISPWIIHRNPEIYPNPERFDPDRFLSENVKQRHSHAYIPFSMGPRNCIGYKIAMMEMKIVMAWILRFFSLSTVDELEDVKMMFDISLKPERMFNVKFTRR